VRRGDGGGAISDAVTMRVRSAATLGCTVVAATAWVGIPPAGGGVATTARPCLNRSRSARRSSALW
jgi:hypothetical protein